MVLGLSKTIYDFNCTERPIPITIKEGSYCFIALCIGILALAQSVLLLAMLFEMKINKFSYFPQGKE
jgi:hypothetical protein